MLDGFGNVIVPHPYVMTDKLGLEGFGDFGQAALITVTGSHSPPPI
jgi:hypothetical protein